MPVSAEELIQYGHRISASNAVSAPLNWQQGDQRRPYPTGNFAVYLYNPTGPHLICQLIDVEMRTGFLSRPESAILAEQREQRMAAAHQAMAAANAARSSMSQHQQHSPIHPGASGSDFYGLHSSPSKQMMPPSSSSQQQQPQSGSAGGGGFSWNSSTGDVGMMKDGSHMTIDQGQGNKDDVEVMSTDSSSSSSTDSN